MGQGRNKMREYVREEKKKTRRGNMDRKPTDGKGGEKTRKAGKKKDEKELRVKKHHHNSKSNTIICFL